MLLFKDPKSSVWFTLGSEDETICFVTLRTIFSVRLPVKVFKTLSDRQSYIVRKFHKSKKYPAKRSYQMLMKKRQAKFTDKVNKCLL